MGRARRVAGRLLLAGAGALVAQSTLRMVMASPATSSLDRVNHRGRTVSLAAGPALAVAAAGTAAAGAASGPAAIAALIAGLGSGAVGLYDDIVGARPEQKSVKGFRGHLAALREGRITSGLVKVGGIGLAGLVSSALFSAGRGGKTPASRSGRLAHVLLGAGVIAGTANLVNLFDLRPGRALKVGVLMAAPLAATCAGGFTAGPLGAAGMLLPDDLDERVMLGDAGANALGALLGLGMAARSGPFVRGALLAGIAGLTLASEKVSFTAVIERTPVLRRLDALGRRPAGPIAAGE
jgi:UDP-N-acetylmuramyl pentapeptide phosphotransferase/UDP-N-acetylglucosamine-1-phosphate transferase